VLQSFDRGSMVLDQFTGHFRVELDRRAGTPVNVIQVVVGPTGATGASERAVVDYIHAIFAGHPQPDLIVTVAGPAAVFARKNRQRLFPDTPILLSAVDRRYLGDAPLADTEAAATVDADFPGFIDGILQLLPRTRQVFVVPGAGQTGRFWRRELADGFRRFQDRVTFIWAEDLSLPEILQRTANLPRDSVIFYLTFGTDAAGAAYAEERVLAELHAVANAPMFGLHSVFLGTGVVGGRLLSIEDLSRNAADAAVRLLNGEPPSSVQVPQVTPGVPTFDWRELQRWNIADSLLPSDSVVRYRSPSLWVQYRFTVLSAAAALIVQSLLIVGLVYQRRARRRAELDSRRNLMLAADANRRQTMSALTGSIAHEIGQPLSAMMLNAQALQTMVTANRATPDAMREILSDIRAQGVQAGQIIDRHRAMLRSHQLDPQPFDVRAAVKESLALVSHDLRSQHVETTVNLPPAPCIVSGDQVLMQQVLMNLILNAMDAMAGMAPGRQHLVIAVENRGSEVEIAVSDTGTGLPANFDAQLFVPFVTTKPHGLGIGLTIAQTIVDAHGGTIRARNNPDGGATFTVVLRMAEASDAGISPSRSRSG
jgi:signal transduction histidine kinase